MFIVTEEAKKCLEKEQSYAHENHMVSSGGFYYESDEQAEIAKRERDKWL